MKPSTPPGLLPEPSPPFRLDLTAWTLRRRPANRIDRWDGRSYRRTFVVDGEAVEVAVSQTGPTEAPRLEVAATGPRNGDAAILVPAIERLLGIGANLGDFHAFAAGDARLAPLAARFRGARPPRFPSLFEALVNAVACQQVTLTLGITLLNRLAARHGVSPAGASPAPAAFPLPEALASADVEELRGLGFSRQKGRSLIALGEAAGVGLLDEARFEPLDDAAAVACLRELPGIGRWSAEYGLLRGLGRWHVFPGDDVGARNNLAGWLGLDRELGYEDVRELVAPWRPYAGLVYFHLLLGRLASNGWVDA